MLAQSGLLEMVHPELSLTNEVETKLAELEQGSDRDFHEVLRVLLRSTADPEGNFKKLTSDAGNN